MRHALPLLYCVSDDIRAKLLGMIKDLSSVPEPEWKVWQPDRSKVILDEVDYGKFMRQAPSRSRG